MEDVCGWCLFLEGGFDEMSKTRYVRCARCGKEEEAKGLLPQKWVGFFSFDSMKTEGAYCPECWAKIKETRERSK